MTLQGENIHTREKRTGPILDNLANGTRAPILIHNNSDVISCNDAHALQVHNPRAILSLLKLILFLAHEFTKIICNIHDIVTKL